MLRIFKEVAGKTLKKSVLEKFHVCCFFMGVNVKTYLIPKTCFVICATTFLIYSISMRKILTTKPVLCEDLFRLFRWVEKNYLIFLTDQNFVNFDNGRNWEFLGKPLFKSANRLSDDEPKVSIRSNFEYFSDDFVSEAK